MDEIDALFHDEDEARAFRLPAARVPIAEQLDLARAIAATLTNEPSYSRVLRIHEACYLATVEAAGFHGRRRKRA